jgi:hypothetical protein
MLSCGSVIILANQIDGVRIAYGKVDNEGGEVAAECQVCSGLLCVVSCGRTFPHSDRVLILSWCDCRAISHWYWREFQPPVRWQAAAGVHGAPAPTAFGEMSPFVVGLGGDCAHGYVRWGFTWRITSAIRLGVLLEPHPLRSAKALLKGSVWGSAGIPDSLGHKLVNTSGGRSPSVDLVQVRSPSHSFPSVNSTSAIDCNIR